MRSLTIAVGMLITGAPRTEPSTGSSATPVLDGAAIRSAILMGPNARHTTPSTLDAEPGPLTVSFDIAVLFARKTERNPAQPLSSLVKA